MSLWLEIHCDVLDGDRLDAVGAPACHAMCGRQVGGMAHNSVESIRRVLDALTREAIGLGWRKQGRNWTCPACQQEKAP